MSYWRDPEKREAQWLYAFIEFAGAHVLEIGCGDGYLTWQYAGAARQVVGIDLDAASLAVARARRPKDLQTSVIFGRATGVHLPFAADTFDVVVFSSSL